MQDGRLALEQVFPGTDVMAVRTQTGFAFATVPEGVSEVAPPTAHELAVIAELDPQRHHRLEFR
jgi:hypothetical protein